MNTNVIAKSKMDGVEDEPAYAVNAADGRGRSKGV